MDFTEKQAKNVVTAILLTTKDMLSKVDNGQLRGATGITESIGEIEINGSVYQLQVSFQGDRRNWIGETQHVLNSIEPSIKNN